MSATEKKKRLFQSNSDVRCRVSAVAEAGPLSLSGEGHEPALLTRDPALARLPQQPLQLRCQGTSELVLPPGSQSWGGWVPPRQYGEVLTGKRTWPEEDWRLGHVM